MLKKMASLNLIKADDIGMINFFKNRNFSLQVVQSCVLSFLAWSPYDEEKMKMTKSLSSQFNTNFALYTVHVNPSSPLAHSCQSFSWFQQHEAARRISTPLNGMLVHYRSLPQNLLGFPKNLPVAIGRERHCESQVSCPRTQHSVPSMGSNLDHSVRGQAH